MEDTDTFSDIYKDNEPTFNIFSRPIDGFVDYFDIPHIGNQSSEDGEVGVYKSIEDSKCVIQETMDNTPSEPKKKEAVKFVAEKKEEIKAIKNEVVLIDDSEQMMNIENKQRHIPCPADDPVDRALQLYDPRQVQFRTKKRERNSTEKYSKGRKKAGHFLIDDLIPFHSSIRKDNKKSKIMIMFVNFAVGFLNEYIKAQRIKKKKFNPIDYLQKKNIGIEDTYKLLKEKKVIDLISKDISIKVKNCKKSNKEIYDSLRCDLKIFEMKVEDFFTQIFLGDPTAVREKYKLKKDKAIKCEFFRENIKRQIKELECEEKMINALEPDFLSLLNDEEDTQNNFETSFDKLSIDEAKTNFAKAIKSKIGDVEIEGKRFQSLINKIIKIITNYKKKKKSDNIFVTNETICSLYKEKFPQEKQRVLFYIKVLLKEGYDFIKDFEVKYKKKQYKKKYNESAPPQPNS